MEHKLETLLLERNYEQALKEVIALRSLLSLFNKTKCEHRCRLFFQEARILEKQGKIVQSATCLVKITDESQHSQLDCPFLFKSLLKLAQLHAKYAAMPQKVNAYL